MQREVLSVVRGAASIVVVATVVIAVPAGAQQPVRAASQPALSYFEVSSIYSILERLISAGVTPQQCRQAVPALQACAQAEAAFYQTMYDPGVIEAWRQVIDKLIAGQAVSDDDLAKANAGGEKLGQAYRAREDACKKAAVALAGCLEDYQLAELGASDKRRAAKDVVRALADSRGARPERWKKWLGERISALVKRFGAGAPDTMTQQLTAFFQQVRNMPTDDFYAKTAQLVGQLTVILNGGKPEPREEQMARVQGWLVGALKNRGVAATLLRWIQHGVAPGQAPAAAAQ